MQRILLVVLALGCSSTVSAEDIQIKAAQIVSYGIFDAGGRQHRTDARPNGPPSDSVKSAHFTEFTDQIPFDRGTYFGLEYVINSSPKGGSIQVTNVIRFPGEGLKLPNGHVYTESRERRTVKIGIPDLYAYVFDEKWEQVPGEWVFEVWHKNSRLIRKTFTVVPSGEGANLPVVDR